jgi:hypothetical protein
METPGGGLVGAGGAILGAGVEVAPGGEPGVGVLPGGVGVGVLPGVGGVWAAAMDTLKTTNARGRKRGMGRIVDGG